MVSKNCSRRCRNDEMCGFLRRWHSLRNLSLIVLILMAVFAPNFIHAGHPLTTDDAVSMGKGRFEIEVGSKFVFDKMTDNGRVFKTRGKEVSIVVPYGLTDEIDLALTIPYQCSRIDVDGITIYDEKGLSDFTIETKWRFYKSDTGLSLALKPTFNLPVGDYKKGLGTGKVTYGLVFISTVELQKWAFHLNLGYTYNDNKTDERKDIWKVSSATELEIANGLKVVTDIGIERNTDKSSSINPAFVLGGLIYSISKNLDIDFGIRAGLNRAEPDMTVLAGMTFRF